MVVVWVDLTQLALSCCCFETNNNNNKYYRGLDKPIMVSMF